MIIKLINMGMASLWIDEIEKFDKNVVFSWFLQK